MNTTGWTKILAGIWLGGLVGLLFALTIALMLGWVSIPWVQRPSPTVMMSSPTPTVPTLQAPQLTVLASGSGVTILEYQGAGVRCIIASGASVDMVCQNSETVPVQPMPDSPDKHQTQPQGLEANALEFPRAGDRTPVLAG